METAKYLCPHCSGPRIAHVRKDGDWGAGGDLYRLNGDKYYESHDPEDIYDFDIDYSVCFSCGGVW